MGDKKKNVVQEKKPPRKSTTHISLIAEEEINSEGVQKL